MMSTHLTLSDRKDIENLLKEGKSFKEIGKILGKDCTTISKEVHRHRVERKTGAFGQSYNACKYRIGCHKRSLCKKSGVCEKGICSICRLCNDFCDAFVEQKCDALEKPPYVCNGCSTKRKCSLQKMIYDAKVADKEYEYTRSESRSGVAIDEKSLQQLDTVISPLLKKGQSIHHICVNNADKIMYSERTLYNYVDYGLFTARNIDMPRKVRYRSRKKPGVTHKVDRECRIGRTYDDYKKVMADVNAPFVVEMDSVLGTKGGKVLMTLHFVKTEFMLAFLRDSNDSQSVIDVFDKLTELLGLDTFRKLFPILLADKGSEFTNPKAIEYYRVTGEVRTKVFYCDSYSAYQRASQEKNHGELRKILPKGTSFDNLVQEDINLVMNHINSYSGLSLNDRTPHEVFKFMFGEEVIKKLGSKLIEPNNICLNPDLLKY
jgi:IS30 family transposase